MTTQISPMLAVRDGRAAIAFYQQAFGATLLWELEGAVAGLSIDGAEFFLAEESPEYGTRSQIPPGSLRSELNCLSMILLACMGRRGRQEPSTIVPSRNIIIRRLDRVRSNECCKARSSIHSDTCG
jgi:catechol 2,3-dioxygenase-like lactoylglutathione lyase family enzyme